MCWKKIRIFASWKIFEPKKNPDLVDGFIGEKSGHHGLVVEPSLVWSRPSETVWDRLDNSVMNEYKDFFVFDLKPILHLVMIGLNWRQKKNSFEEKTEENFSLKQLDNSELQF